MQVKYFERLSFWLSEYLPVHLHHSITSFKKEVKKHLSVCLIYFNLSACQLMCHFTDLSSSMLICLSTCLPISLSTSMCFWNAKSDVTFFSLYPPKPKYYSTPLLSPSSPLPSLPNIPVPNICRCLLYPSFLHCLPAVSDLINSNTAVAICCHKCNIAKSALCALAWCCGR